ncbi:hypothetical protein N7475_000814 [Penicillium sp. IBT 31633x]|nr:hypothetical protein N7475_000814 [Penicillium sp. IBT 31633x]
MSSFNQNPEDFSSLLEAVSKQPVHHLQAILRDIIEHSPEGREIASKWLLAAVMDVQPEPVAPISDTEPAPIPTVSLSNENFESRSLASAQMTPCYEICIFCREPFDINQNSEISCQFHVYPDVIDQEFFKAEIEAGIDVYNDEYRQAWPDKFFYPCCGRDLTEEMCEVGWHEAPGAYDRPCKQTDQKEYRWA